LILIREGEAGIVGVAIHVIRLDSVEAFGLTFIQPGAHERSKEIDPADVEPLLARPAFIVVADHFRRKLIGVGPPIFPTAHTHIADHFPIFFAQRRNYLRVVVE